MSVASVVTITVNAPVGGGGYSLFHYPRRSGDVVVFHPKPGKPPQPGLVREVIWMANGLLPEQTLQIREKGRSQGKGHFKAPFTITHGNSVKQSGWAVKGPPVHQPQVSWSYEVVLLDGSGNELAWLDPDVIIIEDP